MRFHHSAPRDIVAGVPIVMMGTEHRLGTDISLKRKRGGRGKDKAEAGRPRKKCKICGQLGMSEKEQLECKGKGGKRWCPNNDRLAVHLAAQREHNT
jgi:hypothetical protein